VWARWRQAFHAIASQARWVVGGWERLIDQLAAGARERGVRIETGTRVEQLPAGPVIVATELPDAAQLLGDEGIAWPSGATVVLDLGLRDGRRPDPFVVWDLDEAGWIERFSCPDPSVAPPGEQLVEAQLPQRPGEAAEQTQARLEALLDAALAQRRERLTSRRRMVIAGRSGAVDPPGTTWRDRPAVDQGDGRFPPATRSRRLGCCRARR
jgi:phytoene dehydrogenase-like protein